MLLSDQPPAARLRNVAVLGSTGSVGVNALEVCEQLAATRVVGLSGNTNLALLAEQAARFPDARVVACDQRAAAAYGFPPAVAQRIESGDGALERLAASDDVDVVVAAIVGSAGLASTLAAVRSGKTVALANKESLVVAGGVLVPLAARSGARLLPVDSEHSAILQCLLAGRREEVERVILTASGGPFRNWSTAQLAGATPEEATRHPNWNMGAKISVDSATMMNKALEIIEAAWLFGLRADQIGVMIHPQSVVHGLVEFRDGAVLAQLGPPDMRLPIQCALTWPERPWGLARRMDWTQTVGLELFPPDPVRFPALELGYEAVRRGGTAGAILNAANEVAVAAFLDRRLKFTDIVMACRDVLAGHQTVPTPELDQLLAADQAARKETEEWISQR
jgi:1-deoxy-D-xylulose-5-phosphate reductoisomerase